MYLSLSYIYYLPTYKYISFANSTNTGATTIPVLQQQQVMHNI